MSSILCSFPSYCGLTLSITLIVNYFDKRLISLNMFLGEKKGQNSQISASYMWIFSVFFPTSLTENLISLGHGQRHLKTSSLDLIDILIINDESGAGSVSHFHQISVTWLHLFPFPPSQQKRSWRLFPLSTDPSAGLFCFVALICLFPSVWLILIVPS